MRGGVPQNGTMQFPKETCRRTGASRFARTPPAAFLAALNAANGA